MKKNNKIVEVTWFDAQTSTEALTLEEINELKPVLSKSVGYLIVKNDKYIILAFLDFGDGLYKHWQVIPKGMIESIEYLGEKE